MSTAQDEDEGHSSTAGLGRAELTHCSDTRLEDVLRNEKQDSPLLAMTERTSQELQARKGTREQFARLILFPRTERPTLVNITNSFAAGSNADGPITRLPAIPTGLQISTTPEDVCIVRSMRLREGPTDPEVVLSTVNT
jgi:hypothetical protein